MVITVPSHAVKCHASAIRMSHELESVAKFAHNRNLRPSERSAIQRAIDASIQRAFYVQDAPILSEYVSRAVLNGREVVLIFS